MNYFTKKTNQQGFTVIEMITVISIFGIITGVLLFNYKDFKNTTEFKLFVQEIALVLKKQQHMSMSGVININPQVKIYPSFDWKPSYGILFKSGDTKMTLFYDYNQDGHFQDYGLPCKDKDSECIQEIFFTDGRRIGDICAAGVTSPQQTELYQTGALSCTSVHELGSVVFKRPFPDAALWVDYSPEVPKNNGTRLPGTMEIPITDDLNHRQVITVNPTGAIFTRQLTQ